MNNDESLGCEGPVRMVRPEMQITRKLVVPGADGLREREAFEAWIIELDEGGDFTERCREGYYKDHGTQRAWRGWTARALLAAQPASAPAADIDEGQISRMTERGAIAWAGYDPSAPAAEPDPVPASAADTGKAEQDDPVYWEWRHLSTHPDTADFGQWSEWARVKPRSAMHTVEDALAEFRSYISGGYKYELRALYTRPQPAREPMTVSEAEALGKSLGWMHLHANDLVDLVQLMRGVEAHHGITAKAGEQS